MFAALIVVIHIIVCVFLILVILLQSGKGADIGAVFGGGSSHTVFGSTGASTFLSRLTVAAAVTFMLTCIVLTYFSGKSGVIERSIIPEQAGPQVPGPGDAVPQQGPAPSGTETPQAPAERSSAPTDKPAAPAAPPSTPVAPSSPSDK